ncbi:hypothetical protein K3495_g13582 [Podosphaera aphanis]|nr:hypothetical protein K3495_g13582 [Podosphaera aphanis]
MKQPIITEIDNTAALITANSTKISARNRHFLMQEETVRETIKNKIIKPQYTPTDICKADGLIKALQCIKHVAFCNQINMGLINSASEAV